MSKVCLLEHAAQYKPSRCKGYSSLYVAEGDCRNATLLECDLFDLTQRYVVRSQAAKAMDWFYRDYVTQEQEEALIRAFADPRAKNFMQKEIVAQLADLMISFAFAVEFVKKHNIKEKIHFIPKPFYYSIYKILAEKKGFLPDCFTIPAWYLNAMYQQELKTSFVYRMGIKFYPTILQFTMKGKETKYAVKEYKNAALMFDSGIDLKKNINKLEFIHPETGVDQKDTLYVMDRKMSAPVLERLSGNGFDQCYFKEMTRNFSQEVYRKNILPGIKHLQTLFRSVQKPKLGVLRVYLKTIKDFIEWGMFFEKYRVEKFIAVQDPGSVSRTLIQERHGSQTVFVYKSASFDYVYREDMSLPIDLYYSYTVYGTIFSNFISLNNFSRSRNCIENYVDTGTYPSDIIYETKHDPARKDRLKREFGVPLDRKLIGFFDTAIGRAGFFNLEEGIASYRDAYRFIQEHEQYFFIFKTRSQDAIEQSKELNAEFKKLISHERVIFANEKAPHYASFDFMGIFDLVIGGFNSSATQEALVGGVRAVCQVTSDRFDQAVFDVFKMPKFCVRGYDQLKQAAHYWLHECSEEEFKEYQDAYVKKYIDRYCDGQAQQRLHQHLYAASGELIGV
ncbi:MAG TPA: hypothetical protein VI749_07085 [Candidatus Omnitrophota bacterium]|nr:hypothetical protein [Candidatus Omnitrophota bacterium]